MFWVISVYFNIRNTLPKSGTFLLGHPVYVCIYIYICILQVVHRHDLAVIDLTNMYMFGMELHDDGDTQLECTELTFLGVNVREKVSRGTATHAG